WDVLGSSRRRTSPKHTGSMLFVLGLCAIGARRWSAAP
ncbi:MAG: hypothetical protein AVDCRST_MAG01-01-70, partial [uncultured Rubrobacteraceae bacterium]